MQEKITNIKKRVLKIILNRLEETALSTQKSLERTRRDAIESPGRMQSRYDSAKQELSYLADSLQNRLSQIQREITILRSFEITESLSEDEITLGSLIQIEEEDEKRFYFILPVGSGETITTEFGEVITITPSSPLGRSFIGKTVEDIVFIGPRKLTITAIH